MSSSSRIKTRFLSFLGRHSLPLLFFVVLTVAITWPTVSTFTTEYVGDPTEDPPHNLWQLWHVKEALLGRLPLFNAPLLYYPEGISLHLHGIGPLMGVLALPFWPFGPVAAYNGAVLLAFALSGYAVYLLARELNLSQPAAMFTGTLYSLTPMHLGGLLGHFEKIFTALLPLVLLTTLLSLKPRRSRWWAVVTAVTLLLALLHNGLLFIEAALSAAFIILIAFIQSSPTERAELGRRTAITGLSTLLLTGPLILGTVQASAHPGVRVDLNFASPDYQPDVLEFILPPEFSRLFGTPAENILARFNINSSLEKYVYLSWTGLVLALIALVARWRRAWSWLLFTAGWAILALGPSLQLLGRRTFTEYNLPLIMPYAFFTMLPGLDFLRTPGRLMLMGFVGFSITAGIGLHYLLTRWPRHRWAIAAIAAVLVFLEVWPQPWPAQPLRAVPPFYQSLDGETAEFGILDLPIMPPNSNWHVSYSSRYQLDQMTHRQGIAAGYISRPYQDHPLFPCLIPTLRPPQPDILVNGQPANCHANILHDLAYYNYRYVVWHKPQPIDHYSSNPAEVDASSAYLLDQFNGQPPIVDDAMTTVYEIPPLSAATNLSPTLGLIHNWYPVEGGERWAKSPATLFISAPNAQQFRLHITPTDIYDPRPGQSVGRQGQLTISVNGKAVSQVTIISGETLAIPLRLPAGVHIISLALEAGSFRPVNVGGGFDSRLLSFALQSINLETVG